MTEAKPRSLWLQLEGLLYLHNNEGRSLTGLENDTPHMHPELLVSSPDALSPWVWASGDETTELLEHLWVHFFNDIHF